MNDVETDGRAAEKSSEDQHLQENQRYLGDVAAEAHKISPNDIASMQEFARFTVDELALVSGVDEDLNKGLPEGQGRELAKGMADQMSIQFRADRIAGSATDNDSVLLCSRLYDYADGALDDGEVSIAMKLFVSGVKQELKDLGNPIEENKVGELFGTTDIVKRRSLATQFEGLRRVQEQHDHAKEWGEIEDMGAGKQAEILEGQPVTESQADERREAEIARARLAVDNVGGSEAAPFETVPTDERGLILYERAQFKEYDPAKTDQLLAYIDAKITSLEDSIQQRGGEIAFTDNAASIIGNGGEALRFLTMAMNDRLPSGQRFDSPDDILRMPISDIMSRFFDVSVTDNHPDFGRHFVRK